MSSRRIVINTAATYGRSVIAMGMALFSSRWVLNSLGQSDFGLYSVVGSIIVFIVFLNNVLAGGAGRFFAYSIGQGDSEEVNRWFNAALSIHVCLAFVLVAVGWPIGETVVRHVLTIPVERLPACVWVFRISLLSAFVSMLAVPYVAMFTAKQHIAELAVWGLLQSVMSFVMAYLLRYVFVDRIIFYAFGMVGIVIIIQVMQMVRARAKFSECKLVFGKWFDKVRFLEIANFCSWNLIGSTGGILRDQGSAILLNLFFGPKINAAYGISTQVSSQTNQLSAAMAGAFFPEMTACEGKGDRNRMLLLSRNASKYGSLLIIIFAIPLMLEMKYVLGLWLKQPPEYTASFCYLILGAFLIDRLSIGATLAVNAVGKVAAYQVAIGSILLITLPMAWALLKMRLPPTSIGYAFIITATLITIGDRKSVV